MKYNIIQNIIIYIDNIINNILNYLFNNNSNKNIFKHKTVEIYYNKNNCYKNKIHLPKKVDIHSPIFIGFRNLYDNKGNLK